MKKHTRLYVALLLVFIVSAAADGQFFLAQAQKSRSQQQQRMSPAVTPDPTVQVLMLNPSTVSPGQTSSGTVMLTGVAGSAGTAVSLSSSSLDVRVPSTVTVYSGESTASFVAAVSKSAQAGSVTITAQSATGAGMTMQSTLVITTDAR